MSLARDQISCTGRPIRFAITAHSAATSGTPRRPNPPPLYVVWTRTSSRSTPMVSAMNCCTLVGIWHGAQTSTRLPCTWTVQFWGSSGACARYGAS